MKRKININRPKMSSDEIAKNKNFQTVLKKNAIMNTPLFKKPWFLSSIVAAVVATVASILLFNKYSGNNLDKSKEISTCVNPPLKNLDIKYSINKVNAEDGATLDFATGSRVTIPPDAFVDDNGNKLKGEVELRFREFHDVADFFVSGIPMTYDSAGVKYQFESAGMMELLAFQNGKKVNMASDKSVNVELASTYKGTEYNLYKLDTLHNNWSCLGKDKVSSSPIVSADSIKRDSSSSLTEKDVTIEEDVKPEIKKIEIKKEEVVKEKEKAIAALPKPAPEPKKPKQAKNEKYTFDISVDEKEFPELAIYKGVLFEIGEENKNFNPALYDITWDDATQAYYFAQGNQSVFPGSALKTSPNNNYPSVGPVLSGTRNFVDFSHQADPNAFDSSGVALPNWTSFAITQVKSNSAGIIYTDAVNKYINSVKVSS